MQKDFYADITILSQPLQRGNDKKRKLTTLKRLNNAQNTDQPTYKNTPPPDPDFLDLEHLAQVEISSESQQHPIESALLEGSGSGWQAAGSGEQTIRLIFDQPQAIKHISLQFDEQEQSRTQEFVLLWRRDNEDFFREILRQQYHFSPPHSAQEIENEHSRSQTIESTRITDYSGY